VHALRDYHALSRYFRDRANRVQSRDDRDRFKELANSYSEFALASGKSARESRPVEQSPTSRAVARVRACGRIGNW
jgi:hypothetical protein